MLEELRNRIKAVPFVPFAVFVTDGREFPVPHPDHILITSRDLVVIENDEGLLDILPGVFLSGIRSEASST